MKFNQDKQEDFDVNWLKKEHRKRQKIGFPFIERFKRWFCNQFPFYCFLAVYFILRIFGRLALNFF